MGSKSKQTQTTNQTQTSAPPSFTAPGLTETANRVLEALRSLPTNAYSGPMVAVPDAAGTAGVTGAYTNAATQAGNMASWLQGQQNQLTTMPTFSTTLPTASYDVGTGTDLTPAINAAIHPVFQELTTRILPNIRSSAIDSGAYSGDRAMNVLPSMAIADSNEAAQRIAAEIGFQDYTNRENRRLAAWEGDQNRLLGGYQAETARGLGLGDLLTNRFALMPEMADSIMRMTSSQGDLLRLANDYGTARSQAEIDNALAMDQYGMTRPFMGLDIASDLLARLSGGYGTNTLNGTTTTVQKTGGLGPIVQGLLGAGALAMGIPGLGGAGAAAGAGGLGAAMGSAMPFASSIFAPTITNPFTTARPR